MKNRKDHIPYYVITGGPGVGKTTLLQELKKRGMPVVPEIARELIKEQQAMGGEAIPWKNKKLYMELMFQSSVESFEQTINGTNGSDPIFFDRGFLDALCYAALEDTPIEQEMKTLVET
ncbi:AAA family ATPase [Flagellimonas iocasae]|uniref:AAA family ATPase n=1 Tax=Flagellimonas iocasae TaxID=2055905 RepID=A0ABW4Y445_9FLAO